MITQSMVVREIQEALSEPDSTVPEVARLISLDPEIEVQVLRTANSAYYRRAGRVYDLTQAILLIGFGRLSEIMSGL